MSRTDELVRLAAQHPAWARVADGTREALAALYATLPDSPGARGGTGRQPFDEAGFDSRLGELIDMDPILSHLVADAGGTEDGHRAVLPVPGRQPEPVRWGCPESDCTQAPVTGEHDGPYGSTTCDDHPGVPLEKQS
ncbi:hypothetical protein [Streptomyces sp. NPDC004538]|uniref:hypothetical protein n=1 Tax=unclassified Streptomyces TaxID=2593676 RepID=UPI0033A2A5FD